VCGAWNLSIEDDGGLVGSGIGVQTWAEFYIGVVGFDLAFVAQTAAE
jgi:hypothetical protein